MVKTLAKILAIGLPLLGAVCTTSFDFRASDPVAPIVAKGYLVLAWTGLWAVMYSEAESRERREQGYEVD